jgi:N-acyl-D-amino-acid deacylase
MIGLVEDARARGEDVTWDTYPYEWASTRLLIMLPPWVQAGGPARLLERIADRAVRDRLRDEMGARGAMFAGPSAWHEVRLGALRSDAYRAWEGRTLGELMDAGGLDVVDTTCDLLLAEDLRTNQVTPGPAHGSLGPFLSHPVSMVGTDSTFVGDKPSPRTWGSFPRVLGEFVREQRLMGLEEAVRKMTSAPAARLGIPDRGLLRDGMRADITLFDPATVASTATYDEPRSYPVGIPWVIVNGVVVVDDGAHTGALPGRALRRGRTEA